MQRLNLLVGKVLLVKKKNSSRGEYDFAPCSPRRASVCLHTIIVTLDNHCYTVALYIISMIYLCHYLFVHLTPTSLCHCLHPEEVSCEVNWGYGGQFGNNPHRLWMKCVKKRIFCLVFESDEELDPSWGYSRRFLIIEFTFST